MLVRQFRLLIQFCGTCYRTLSLEECSLRPLTVTMSQHVMWLDHYEPEWTHFSCSHNNRYCFPHYPPCWAFSLFRKLANGFDISKPSSMQSWEFRHSMITYEDGYFIFSSDLHKIQYFSHITVDWKTSSVKPPPSIQKHCLKLFFHWPYNLAISHFENKWKHGNFETN